MSSVNKVILIGNLGDDPEVRYMPNGTAVCNISLATSESWKDQQGQKQEKTEWHKVTMYRKLAEVAGEYLKKGSSIYIEGKLQTRKWQDQQGNDRYTTEVVADKMQMLGGKSDNQGQSQGAYQPSQQSANHGRFNSDGSAKTPEQMKQPQPQQQRPQSAPPMTEPDFSYDDDIPFAPIWKQYPKILYCM